MPSPFDMLDEDLSASVLWAFGEAAALRPRVASQYTERAADPARPPVDLFGVFSAGSGETHIKGKATGGSINGPTRFATTPSEFWIEAAQVALIPYAIAPGDLIVLTERGGATFEVVSAQSSNMGDVNLILSLDGVEL